MKRFSDVNTVKCENRALVLKEIRKNPLSRAMLAQTTGLSKSAITAIVEELIKEGRLCETDSLSTPKGRRPVLLDIAARHRYAAGLYLHRKKLGALITDLKSGVVAESYTEPSAFRTGEEAAGWLCAQVTDLVRREGLPHEKLIGVGISSPGPLDHAGGVILNPPNFTLFRNVDIVSIVQSELSLPAVLENNAVLLAMSEYFHGGMKKFKNSMFVIVSNGIGACVMMDGQIYRGVGGFAGELGHTSIDLHGPVCSCGNRGCVELYATLSALRESFGFEDYSAVVDLAERGDAFALSVIDYEAECLSSAMIGAVNLLDLDSIILYGELNVRPGLLLSKIESLINERSFIARAHKVSVLPSHLSGADASSATAAILDRYFGE